MSSGVIYLSLETVLVSEIVFVSETVFVFLYDVERICLTIYLEKVMGYLYDKSGIF